MRFVVVPDEGCPVNESNATMFGRCGEPITLNEWDQPTCPRHGVLHMHMRVTREE